jgi:hypothetical protein
MTREEFRRIALALPEAIEGAHQGGPDFRVGKKIFATFGPRDPNFAVVKLSPGDQDMRTGAEPGIFEPVTGAWGRQGWTKVNLAAADATTVRSALVAAWRAVAPKTLAAKHPLP